MEKSFSSSTSPFASALATDPHVQAALMDGVDLPPTFADLARRHGVPDDVMEEFKERSLAIIAHKRRDAAGAFAFGADLVYVASHVHEDGFEEFVQEAYPYSSKYVSDFIRIASELGGWRTRCIKVSFSTTHLMRLLARTPQERDQILERAEQGERITAGMISSWGAPELAPVDPMRDGGMKGLRKLAQAKAGIGVRSFGMNVGAVISAIEEVISPETGTKALEKKSLVAAVQKPARQACGELVNLALFVTPGTFGDVSPQAFPAGCDWGVVHDVLYRIGHELEWPKKPQMRPWLTDVVLPVLRWAVSGSGPIARSASSGTEAAAAPELVPFETDMIELHEPVDIEVPAADERVDVLDQSASAVAVQRKVVPASGEAKPGVKNAVPSPFHKRPGSKQDSTTA